MGALHASGDTVGFMPSGSRRAQRSELCLMRPNAGDDGTGARPTRMPDGSRSRSFSIMARAIRAADACRVVEERRPRPCRRHHGLDLLEAVLCAIVDAEKRVEACDHSSA